MDIYENVVIGSFLYALGLEVGGAARQPASLGVNLLQQTPIDGPLADIVLNNTAFFRLIEFKRSKNRSPKEHDKRSALLAALNSSEGRRHLPISREVHWYVETGERGEWSAAAVPYIDFGCAEGHHDFLGFIRATARAALEQPLSEGDVIACKAYLRFVAGLTDGRQDGDTGCLLITGGGGAPLSYAPLRSLRDILLSTKEIFANVPNLGFGHEHARESMPQRGRSLRREIELELDLGL